MECEIERAGLTGGAGPGPPPNPATGGGGGGGRGALVGGGGGGAPPASALTPHASGVGSGGGAPDAAATPAALAGRTRGGGGEGDGFTPLSAGVSPRNARGGRGRGGTRSPSIGNRCAGACPRPRRGMFGAQKVNQRARRRRRSAKRHWSEVVRPSRPRRPIPAFVSPRTARPAPFHAMPGLVLAPRAGRVPARRAQPALPPARPSRPARRCPPAASAAPPESDFDLSPASAAALRAGPLIAGAVGIAGVMLNRVAGGVSLMRQARGRAQKTHESSPSPQPLSPLSIIPSGRPHHRGRFQPVPGGRGRHPAVRGAGADGPAVADVGTEDAGAGKRENGHAACLLGPNPPHPSRLAHISFPRLSLSRSRSAPTR